ncbi:DEAD/DEAH box helicase [Pseudomonas oryziphila]|uniref:DEAD/DEAH box helicase n=1 Tax=Pseudomonas entomophila TaxID=312306 RepID=A0A3Q8U3H8_9PSED|nr:DEAD/DEAH box helicase [Pseudomonas oryziphila]AZL70081.1 DEAD/DEAH box helicase [Pseudomonas oryziphila]
MKRPRLLNSQPVLLEAAVFDGYDMGILMPYIEGANKVMFARSGFFIRRGDHPFCRYWRVPKAKLIDELDLVFHQLLELTDGKFSDTWQGFRQKIEAALTTPRRDAFTWGMLLRIAPLADGGVLLSGDYHPGVVAVARRMRGVFLGRSSSWRINATAEILRSNLILELGLVEEQFEILDVVQELLGDGSVVPAADIPRISLGGGPQEPSATASGEETSNDIYLAAVSPIERTEFSDDAITQALLGYSLLDHQPAGIAHLLQRTSALLADDMGLGKTRQAVIAAHISAAGRPILVVTLSSLLINWQREVLAVYPDATIALQKHDPHAQWMLINYERLGDYVLLAEHYHVLVVDEAHQLKEPTAERTRHGFDIAAKVPNRYLLTGTPVLNRETELHTLLRLSGHPVGQLPLSDFCERFAGSPEFRQNLRAELGDWMLRRRKDVLPGLKGKQRQLLAVALRGEERRKYDSIRLEDKPIFARLGALRHYLEQVKVRVAMDLLSELDPEDKVILFCEFKPTVERLKELCVEAGIGNVTLIGSDSLTKRQKAIDKFQGDPDCRVFICTTRAAGTGNNLTAANYVFFLGLPWTPGQQDQAEDRAYRNGQLRTVIVKIPLVENSIDQQLWQMLLAKRQVSLELIEPEEQQDALAKTMIASTMTQ